MSLKYGHWLSSIKNGHSIVITGKATASANRFDIDLTEGAEDHGHETIFLHMSVRFGEGVIVRNTRVRRVGWGSEEREENLIGRSSANPIKCGENFKITINVVSDAFFVMIDENPFCVFPHRQPVNEVHMVKVYGDVDTIHEVKHVQ